MRLRKMFYWTNASKSPPGNASNYWAWRRAILFENTFVAHDVRLQFESHLTTDATVNASLAGSALANTYPSVISQRRNTSNFSQLIFTRSTRHFGLEISREFCIRQISFLIQRFGFFRDIILMPFGELKPITQSQHIYWANSNIRKRIQLLSNWQNENMFDSTLIENTQGVSCLSTILNSPDRLFELFLINIWYTFREKATLCAYWLYPRQKQVNCV